MFDLHSHSRWMLMALAVCALASCGPAETKRASDMVETEPIRAQFGEVAAGLLTYEFHPIPDDELTTGQKQALDSARGWMEQIISDVLQSVTRDFPLSDTEMTEMKAILEEAYHMLVS